MLLDVQCCIATSVGSMMINWPTRGRWLPVLEGAGVVPDQRKPIYRDLRHCRNDDGCV